MEDQTDDKKTIHICKFDPDKASRIQMQLGWDKENTLVLGNKLVKDDHDDSRGYSRYQTLRLLTLLTTLNKGYGYYIFHEQSTLPYLFFVILLRSMLCLNIRVVYDMHDLNEETPAANYRYMRYLVCYLLEFLVAHSNVQIITVSQGLRNELIKRYPSKKSIHIVYNIPDKERQVTRINFTNRGKLLYFGQIEPERITVDLLQRVEKSGLKLFLHGSITFNPDETKAILDKYLTSGTIVMMGAYQADDLSFLEEYEYSIIDYSTNKSKNVQFCLPNKLFQSLKNGLVCLISSNLQEARELFKDYPDNVITILEGERLDDIIKMAHIKEGKVSNKNITDYLNDLVVQSKTNYLQAVYY